jgi:hypothetical protein
MLAKYKDYIKKSLRSRPNQSCCYSQNEGLPRHPRSAQAEFMLLVCGQASVCCNVDSLRYCLRVIDIAFALSQLAGYCVSAGSNQCSLEGFPSLQMITYRHHQGAIRDLLSGFADSDWGNGSPCRSTSGNLMLYAESPIAFQDAEAEFYAASAAGVDILYLQKPLERLGSLSHSGSPSLRESPRRSWCSRTTQRALSGETTSSVDESESSTVTTAIEVLRHLRDLWPQVGKHFAHGHP